MKKIKTIDLIPIGFFLIIFGVVSYTIEYVLFGTRYMISCAWIGLVLSGMPLLIIACRKEEVIV